MRAKQWHEIIGDIVHLYITFKEETYTVKLDRTDMHAVVNRRWCLHRTKAKNGRVKDYAKNGDFGLMHRHLTDAPRGLEVDHINGDTLDNRQSNLRFVTSKQNKQNVDLARQSNSGIRGIKWSKQTNKWRVSFQDAGKEYHVGFYPDFEVAKNELEKARASYLPFSKEAAARPDLASDLSDFKGRLRSDNTSGVKGIDWENRRNYWRVRVKGKEIFTSKSLEEAKKFLEKYKEMTDK